MGRAGFEANDVPRVRVGVRVERRRHAPLTTVALSHSVDALPCCHRAFPGLIPIARCRAP